ncbi:MAG: hypothetical protein HW421_3116 [Ignavibacteria bacterium]|nr:hypothetical protein [Ignavibacteria bacterium]
MKNYMKYQDYFLKTAKLAVKQVNDIEDFYFAALLKKIFITKFGEKVILICGFA